MSEEKVVDAVASPAPAPAASTSNPPGTLPDGGTWGTVKYVGSNTQMTACLACLCCGPFALCICLCPTDEKDGYAVNGKVYDAEGKFIKPKDDKFVPKREKMER